MDLAWMQDWWANVRTATDEGKSFRRVRVVSLPLTDYSRFGLWLAQHTCEAGEDIRYLARDQADDLPDFDYWLFDSRRAAKMHFGDDDVLLGFELIKDPKVITELNYQRDAAWHHAITRGDFAAQHLDQR